MNTGAQLAESRRRREQILADNRRADADAHLGGSAS
jgi:hypothetical protein